MAALAERGDALPADPKLNADWAWFHVAEDEIGRRGQIRWLRARLRGDRGVERRDRAEMHCQQARTARVDEFWDLRRHPSSRI
jgi:hypothetical protein